MSVAAVEAQVKRNIDALEQIFANHEKFLEKLGSAVSEYIETADILKPLIEVAGAEIESKGRASRRTVYGKSRFMLRKRHGRGKGIYQYLSEKTWLLSTLIRLIGVERAESSQQARYLYSTLREEKVEENAEENEGGNEETEKSKKMKLRLKRIENLTKKCEKILDKDANRDKKLIKITAKELILLKKAYHLSLREGIFVRKLTRIVGSSRALKILEKLFRKEEIYFSKFIKEENWIVTDISKELKDIFKVIKENEKISKLSDSSISFGAEKGKIKKEKKTSKRVRRLMKSLKKIQKHIKKIKKGAAKYGMKIEGSISLLNFEERKLLKEEEEEEKDLNELDNLFESMERFSSMISRFENLIDVSEIGLEPQIKWINAALVSAYKISKKNPTGVLSFLSKVGNFAEKALIPQLRKMDDERKELFKEFTGEDGVVKNLERDMDALYGLENGGFIKGLEKMEISLKKIERNSFVGNKRAIHDLRKDILELKHALKEEKVIVRDEVKAKAPKTKSEEIETKAKIKELNQRIADLKSRYRDMRHEFDPAVAEFRKAIANAPQFKFAHGGFFSIFGGGLVDHIVGDIDTAEHYLNAEEKEDSKEIQALNEWISNVADIKNYAVFVKTLYDSFVDEGLLLKRMISFYRFLSILDRDFSSDMRKAERMINDLEIAIRDLDEVMNKYPDMFGEEEREIFGELREIYTQSFTFLNELKKTENVLAVFSHNIPQMVDANERAEAHIGDMKKILKEATRNAKKLERVLGKEVQAKL